MKTSADDFKSANCRIFYSRILRLSSTRVLEIYPGDGSVIVSQGVKGLYYKHLSPYGDRVDKWDWIYNLS